MSDRRPAILVWSSLFPSAVQPQAGSFVRERMFRVAKHLPVAVVSPQPWSPFDVLIRRFRPHFRPSVPRYEVIDGIEIFRPRYCSVPGFLKRYDAILMAIGALPTVRRLIDAGRADLIDAHFTFPDGCAAAKVGAWTSRPVTITLRGTEARHIRDTDLRWRMIRAWRSASKLFAVSNSLRRLAVDAGVDPGKALVVGNGVDLSRFAPIARSVARQKLGLRPDSKILVTVGGLVERKGFNRVIDCLPELLSRFPALHYLIVGGAGPEGDYATTLRSQIRTLGVEQNVSFLGPLSPEGVCAALSAADVFVLASRNEGWANVILEAMACGLPVVATDVGGNSEVVCHSGLGAIVPFGDQTALIRALAGALSDTWDPAIIRRYAAENSWEPRVALLVREFLTLTMRDAAPPRTWKPEA